MNERLPEAPSSGSTEELEKASIRGFFEERRGGLCVEVGSNESLSVSSQSWHLEDRLDWKCILVEPNPELARAAREARPRASVYECACVGPHEVGSRQFFIPISDRGEVASHASLQKNADDHHYERHRSITVEARTLDQIIESAGAQSVDFLSVDVEGTELQVLEGFDFSKYRPELILLEDKHLYLNKHRYLKKQGYRLVRRLNRNCWYVPTETLTPRAPTRETLRLLKRMYLSIWLKKLRYAIEHRSLDPFRVL